MGGNERYQIRKAAGVYWLLDMEQSGIEGRGCVMLNESGALIWDLYARLGSVREVAEKLSSEFGVLVPEAETDVRQFLQQLKKQGIVFKE